MSLRVLGRKTSINVRKVLWTCAELDLHFEHLETDQKLLARNPNAMVPVIDDAGFVLWESNSICRYLANKQPRDNTLLPADPQARGLVEQWMDWQATELNTSWRYAFNGLVRNSPAHADPAAIAASVDSWNKHMRILDEHFEQGGQFITGEFFTLADVVLGLSTHRWLHSPIERPPLDAVHGYYQRLSVRPAFRAHVDPHVP
jgi:glutathione S-transferase